MTDISSCTLAQRPTIIYRAQRVSGLSSLNNGKLVAAGWFPPRRLKLLLLQLRPEVGLHCNGRLLWQHTGHERNGKEGSAAAVAEL